MIYRIMQMFYLIYRGYSDDFVKPYKQQCGGMPGFVDKVKNDDN